MKYQIAITSFFSHLQVSNFYKLFMACRVPLIAQSSIHDNASISIKQRKNDFKGPEIVLMLITFVLLFKFGTSHMQKTPKSLRIKSTKISQIRIENFSKSLLPRPNQLAFYPVQVM